MKTSDKITLSGLREKPLTTYYATIACDSTALPQRLQHSRTPYIHRLGTIELLTMREEKHLQHLLAFENFRLYYPRPTDETLMHKLNGDIL